MEKNNNIKILFNTIQYQSLDDVDKLLNNMETTKAFFLLTEALDYAHNKNCFSIVETEIISKAIRLLYNENLNSQSTNKKKDE